MGSSPPSASRHLLSAVRYLVSEVETLEVPGASWPGETLAGLSKLCLCLHLHGTERLAKTGVISCLLSKAALRSEFSPSIWHPRNEGHSQSSQLQGFYANVFFWGPRWPDIDLVINTAVLPCPVFSSPLAISGLALPKALPATKVPPPSDFNRAARLGSSKNQEVLPVPLVVNRED